jgi:hypothetical protein
MSTTPAMPAIDLGSVAFLLTTGQNRNIVGAYRLVDLAEALNHTPEELYALQLGDEIGENLLLEAASRTDPLFSTLRASYDAALEDVRAEADAQGLLALTHAELKHRADDVVTIPAQPAEGEATFRVTSITIEGSVLRDMYDDHPGLAYFRSSSSVGVHVPEPLTINQAMETALTAWKAVCEEEAGVHEEAVPEDLGSEIDVIVEDPTVDDDYDGKFSASRIVLRDRSGEVVQQYDGSNWVTDFTPADKWKGLLEQAKALEDEASEEARWDNFSTSDNLCEKATRLRRQVAIARANLPEPVEAALPQPVPSLLAVSEPSPLSRDQVLYAKRTSMATTFFVARPWDDDHGFDRLMKMRTIQEVKPDLDGWGVVALHGHFRGTGLQEIQSKVSDIATSLLHNLSGVSREVANEQLTYYSTTNPPPEVIETIDREALIVGQMSDARLHTEASTERSKHFATVDSPSLDM